MSFSLVHSVRVLPDTIGCCTIRDWIATLEVTLNGGSVWTMPWSWFGAPGHVPDQDRVEQTVVKLLEWRMKLVTPQEPQNPHHGPPNHPSPSASCGAESDRLT